jgi:hypothetical protein
MTSSVNKIACNYHFFKNRAIFKTRLILNNFPATTQIYDGLDLSEKNNRHENGSDMDRCFSMHAICSLETMMQ